jgi:hypothetical protein
LTTKHTVRICCDNKSAISFPRNRQIYKEITSKIPDFDILQAIRKLTGAQYLSFHHVKGHQDREQMSLDFYATLNVQVDRLAKVAAQQSLSKEELMIDGEIWDVHVGEHKLVKITPSVQKNSGRFE